jgi:hypothetical protein
MFSDLGSITFAILVESSQHFETKVKADTNHSMLQLLDNYSAHFSMEVINFCPYGSSNLITIAPHTSHKVQLWDIFLTI